MLAYYHLNLLLVVSEMADMNTVGDVQGRMCMTNLFGWPGSSCRKEMGSEAR